ncbi:plasmid SOS inhibition protein A, partial [Salmonella enterica]|nr:plasmid SOS inhibition protein A [Salmonella enterica]EBJ2272041.1 plasmid SOS inhibition protein A [Salmonella enterica]EBO0324243.1 plasmid SOS inhibition protein A [Salmonella enterica]
DLEDMFWRWSERFPSLEPMERWMVPNKLMHQEAS